MESRRKLLLQSLIKEEVQNYTEETSTDSSEFLWAVSYSDLLMVLMSFFIVYFSFTSENGKSLIDEISAQLDNKQPISNHALKKTTVHRPQQSEPEASDEELITQSNLVNGSTAVQAPLRDGTTVRTVGVLRKIQDHLKHTSIAEKDLNGLTALRLDLADNAFSPGEYVLNTKTKEEIDQLLMLLVPFRDRITLTFIGHADQVPIHPLKKNAAIQSNMNLSSLRAGSAVAYAISKGFDRTAIWIEGFAEFGRNTRSLSLRIKERVKP